jgi:glycosyltransferase involved in cell wall biosynthesis
MQQPSPSIQRYPQRNGLLVNDTDFDRVRAAGEAVFLIGSVAIQRGGVTRAVLARAHLFAEAGIKVRLLLTQHLYLEDREELDVRRDWGLPDSVEIRYFWREAPPGGGGAPADSLVSAHSEPGMTTFVEERPTGQSVRFFRDGLLVKTKSFVAGGGLHRIQYFDAARRCTAREQYDRHGRLVFVDQFDVNIGKPTLRRWFNRSGACWLTSWLNSSGRPAATVRHLPAPVAYANHGQCVAEWVDKVLADVDAAVLFSDARMFDHVLLAMTHPRVRKVPVLHNCHTSFPYRAEDQTRSTWLPLLENLNRVDAVVSLTHKQRDHIAERYGGTNLHVINHPTPLASNLRMRRQPALLVVVARLEKQKRLDHAIQAFTRAASQVPEARFDIYGAGSEAKALKALVRELNMADRIRFHGFTKRPLEIFASASATVLSSLFEGFPLVLNEAMGVGTPFVAYDINYGPSEVIRHDVDGLLVPSGDIDALADAMVRVLGEPDYAAKLGERSREATERFSTARWQAEWMKLFTGLVRSTMTSLEAGAR